MLKDYIYGIFCIFSREETGLLQDSPVSSLEKMQNIP
jgi:hypothetical protein